MTSLWWPQVPISVSMETSEGISLVSSLCGQWLKIGDFAMLVGCPRDQFPWQSSSETRLPPFCLGSWAPPFLPPLVSAF